MTAKRQATAESANRSEAEMGRLSDQLIPRLGEPEAKSEIASGQIGCRGDQTDNSKSERSVQINADKRG